MSQPMAVARASALAATIPADELPRLRRRMRWVLFAVAALGSTGYIAAVTVGTLVAADLSGGAALGGLPTTMTTIGTATAASLIALIMLRWGRRIGFLREGTHRVCDPAVTRQLTSRTLARLDQVRAALDGTQPDIVSAIDLAEDLEGDQCALHVIVTGAAGALVHEDLAPFGRLADVGGVSAGTADGGDVTVVAGTPDVWDPLQRLVPGVSG